MSEVFEIVVSKIQNLYAKNKPILVTIDDINGSGKSIFAKKQLEKIHSFKF